MIITIIINRHLSLLCLYINYILALDIIMIVFVYIEEYIISIKENMICQDYNEKFNYKIKVKFNYIYIYINNEV